MKKKCPPGKSDIRAKARKKTPEQTAPVNIDPVRYQRLLHEKQERLKELSCINRTTSILKEGKPIDETLLQICQIIPQAWHHPESAVVRILFEGMEFRSLHFKETRWCQTQVFETIDNQKGRLDVFYLKEFPASDEGPFLKEERELLHNLANIITGYLNSVKGKALLRKIFDDKSLREKYSTSKVKPEYSRQLLQTFLNKSNCNRDIYHDLMPFKVREILLLASLYDAYNVEKEGKFSEYILGDYLQMNLTSIPRITGVSTIEEAMEQLRRKHYDLVIMMMGVDITTPIKLSGLIKREFPDIPVFMLLNNDKDLALLDTKSELTRYIDNVFIWNGESRIFFAMVKLLEDEVNVANDTKVGLVRIILLIEDSTRYFSRYLPLLYHIVMEQTRQIITDVSSDELYKVLKLRVRPKILLATNYEQAMQIVNKYEDHMLCLITDMKFPKQGIPLDNAGVEIIQQIRKDLPRLPIILQSSQTENEKVAYDLKVTYVNKNSENLLQDLKSFITHYLGFGNFFFRDNEGNQIAVAQSLREFEKQLKTIPGDSLLYHARHDHFSLWLMAHGEIQAARILHPKKVDEFKSVEHIRQYLLSVIQQFRDEQNKGKVVPFEESAITDETNVVSLSAGSLGGKGRGLAFINTLIYNFDFTGSVSNINIRTPITAVIGTDEFEYFMIRNNLFERVLNMENYEEIKKLFLKGHLTETLVKRLKIYLKLITKPLAVRSSGLFEDSLMQPFAGIFETYLLPNSHPDPNERLNQLTNAIKLVFASIFSPVARGYIHSIHYTLEEEKMAVVIQEVVGNRFEDTFYPHISGVAQSYNYYPFSYMKPEEGFAVLALGLGKYVVEGEKAYRFSPKYPNIEINTPKAQFQNSQLEFFAVDMKKKNINLLEGDTAGLIRLDVDHAKRHGTLMHCASVYNIENNTIIPGLRNPGPRIINFADILKYNYIPLAQTIDVTLDVVKEALGSPVEIEFAVDLNKDKDYKASFYLLQIKPLIGSSQDYTVDMDKINRDHLLLYTEKGMGNGMISNIQDVIYVDRNRFDKSRTSEMAGEIDQLNTRMRKEGKQYVLIGPGRWGTRDRWIGIPVNWPQISNAKIIVETSLEGFPLDASSGSHFFHNVTSMNVGYFSIQEENPKTFLRWDVLDKQPLVAKTNFFNHICFQKPLTIKMDGKQRISVITWQ
ncbi:MAG: PEP/pyruvate-binding domain-containing protein [Bacteroidales bacterium]|nr:pyruvate, phosphate dikinase [Lentimicrobiaceae bacterium]MDD5693798.1 PEP/pyruvate-binding domain-containing protein [Bacteroidales bacterium]